MPINNKQLAKSPSLIPSLVAYKVVTDHVISTDHLLITNFTCILLSAFIAARRPYDEMESFFRDRMADIALHDLH